ncbi:MAG: prepilin-type N-terminal cleavage/methylation domain-containing protein [Verrucomicrobiota bacterium]|jgi:prepilin-type N-terminal cleavage/methylation domain-containing protein|nr:prepilin-type N-terminal cleavage/methylation domain-containing protein [Verrucomicrobiota bacterium]MDD8052049.1 prepilin-type N-terminal cleavage/methylation domain-containing protein [Verrucomicrobiota bacterium]MDI9383349.1 prepilin-type N-terminal cleavage/methylation domain-containing protein [Verrucomicrobiota bacterium]
MKKRGRYLQVQGRQRGSHVSAGFTLVEVVLALAVVAVGMMGVLGLFPVGIKAGRDVVQETHAAAVERMVTSFIRADFRGTGVMNYNTHPWRNLNVPQVAPDGNFMPLKDGGLDWDKDGSPDFHLQYSVVRDDDLAERIQGLVQVYVRIGYPVQTDEVDSKFDYNQIRYLTIELANDIL